MKYFSLIILTCLFLIRDTNNTSNELLGSGIKNDVVIHIISVGINDYGINFPKFKNCENDAIKIVEKIEDDALNIKNLNSGTRGLNNFKRKDSIKQNKIKVNKHLLLGELATLENLRKAFKDVIKKSTTNDYFFFFFAGRSNAPGLDKNIALSTYTDKQGEKIGNKSESYEFLSFAELSSFMNQITAKNQVIISEAGNGKLFTEQLQKNLFEFNPDLALNTERNRIILTTLDYGYDTSECDEDHGPLTYYILNSGDLFNVFKNYHYYEYSLNKTEVSCSPRDRKYYYMSREEDLKKIYRYSYDFKTQSRGAISEKIANDTEVLEQNESESTKTYALIIATNEYNEEQQNWSNLKNPINDAHSISKLLETKYNVSITKIYNEPKQNIIKGIIELKKSIGKNDKLIVFIAGHGYYSNELSQGYIVTSDSASLNGDVTLNTYLPMSTLNNLLDGFICKPIFTILDICYGSSFEIYNQDLAIENYSNTVFDNGIEDFIDKTDESYGRIMLASGEGEVPDFWNNSLDHSPFASKLIKSLEEEDKFISPGRIYSYVRGNTTTPILKKFGKHEVTGDFLLKVK